MVKPTLPVDIYVRVSRVGKRENLISPDEQEARARRLADEQGLRVGGVFEDRDESGGKLNRPGLSAVLERVERKESGGVIVAWLDRLSRDSEHALGYLRRIEQAGGKLYAPDAPADAKSPEGELQLGIVFAFAQYVRSKARAGFERSKEQAIARGIPVITRPAVGLRQREDRRLEPDPDVAPIVREVFERRAQGAGPADLGRFLESRGVKTSQGSSTWSKQAVYGLLKNRVYLGELRYGKDSRYVNSDAVEPIVDVATWQAAQHPNGRRLAAPRSDDSPYLLTGLLRCAGCRYCMQATTTSRGKRIYRCTRTRAGGTCEAPARIAAEDVEQAGERAFWAVARDMEARGTQRDDLDLSELRAALERANERVRQLESAEAQDALGDRYFEVFRERRAEQDAAAQALGEAEASIATAEDVPNVETLRRQWDRATTQERRELMRIYLDCIALGRDGVFDVYPRETAPDDLPRRGFKSGPQLQPFPAPAGRFNHS